MSRAEVLPWWRSARPETGERANRRSPSLVRDQPNAIRRLGAPIAPARTAAGQHKGSAIRSAGRPKEPGCRLRSRGVPGPVLEQPPAAVVRAPSRPEGPGPARSPRPHRSPGAGRPRGPRRGGVPGAIRARGRQEVPAHGGRPSAPGDPAPVRRGVCRRIHGSECSRSGSPWRASAIPQVRTLASPAPTGASAQRRRPRVMPAPQVAQKQFLGGSRVIMGEMDQRNPATVCEGLEAALERLRRGVCS